MNKSEKFSKEEIELQKIMENMRKVKRDERVKNGIANILKRIK